MAGLEFEQQAFVELLSEDGLIILARGLGLDRLFLKFLKLHSDPHNLVLVLNCTSSQEKHYVDQLTGEEVECLPKSVNNEYSAKDREQLYLKGGVLFVTSRILVVDFLKKHCPIDKVSGLLVCNAHSLREFLQPFLKSNICEYSIRELLENASTTIPPRYLPE